MSKPAQRGEHFAPHEKGLIAVKRAEGAVVPAFNGFQPAQPGMAFIKAPVKRPAHNLKIGEAREGLQMLPRQQRVCVLKQKPIAGGCLGSEIELTPAIRRSRMDAPHAQLGNRIHRDGISLRKRDDDFPHLRRALEDRNQRLQAHLFPPDRNDRADQSSRPLRSWVALEVHSSHTLCVSAPGSAAHGRLLATAGRTLKFLPRFRVGFPRACMGLKYSGQQKKIQDLNVNIRCP